MRKRENLKFSVSLLPCKFLKNDFMTTGWSVLLELASGIDFGFPSASGWSEPSGWCKSMILQVKSVEQELDAEEEEAALTGQME